MVFLDSNESLLLSEVGLAYDDIPACFEGRRRPVHTVYSLNIRCIDLPILSITIALVREKQLICDGIGCGTNDGVVWADYA